MTLRLRLAAATVALVAVGLALFGVSTYAVYRSSQYAQLDGQLRDETPDVGRSLGHVAGLLAGPQPGDAGAGPPGSGGRDHGLPDNPAPPGTFAELRSAAGVVLAHVQFAVHDPPPALPANLPAEVRGVEYLTVASASGSGGYRVAISNAPDLPGATVVLAVPTAAVVSALHRLVLIEALGALGLLVVLSAGSMALLRRGLRPLEAMAVTARSISAGDLSQRVAVGGPAEVGEVGAAINTMLDDIEVAFAGRDATELRLRQFLADASHELRTPLTSIRGFAELFRVSGDAARVDLPTILRRIEEESGRMKGLVDDLLLLARLDAPQEPSRRPVDLSVIAADACNDAIALDPARSVTLDAPDPVVVAGDEGHLRQAVGNLVANAVRHTPPGSPVEVRTAVADGRALVEVRDHGGGLDAEGLAHVFDRFWQADRARAGHGSGLGLSIVAGIAAEHGGAATVASFPGGGATFTLALPI